MSDVGRFLAILKTHIEYFWVPTMSDAHIPITLPAQAATPRIFRCTHTDLPSSSGGDRKRGPRIFQRAHTSTLLRWVNPLRQLCSPRISLANPSRPSLYNRIALLSKPFDKIVYPGSILVVYPLRYLFVVYALFFFDAIVLAVVVLLLCDCACTNAPFLWLIMLKRSNHARGCAHFSKYFACPSLCDFLLFRWPGFCPLVPSSCFAREHYVVSQHSCFACVFFFLQRCSTPQTILRKPSRRQTFLAPCTPAYGQRLVYERQIKVLFVELTNYANERRVLTAHRYCW